MGKLSDLIGMADLKTKARIQIRACLNSGETFPHTLITGIGGLGKTAFARAVGEELGYHFVETEGAVFRTRLTLSKSLVRYSQEAQERGQRLLLFIDETHRLPLDLQEALYFPMTDCLVRWMEGHINRRSHELKIPPFTLMGATTRFHMLDANSFVTRFSNMWEVCRYDEESIGRILAQQFRDLGVGFNFDVIKAIRGRCLGIPRIAVNLAQKIYFMALSENVRTITETHVSRTFRLEGIDSKGLSPVHSRYLEVLASSKKGGEYIPIGLKTIAARMRQPLEMIEGAVEPILLEFEFVDSTARGRVLTQKGCKYFRKVA